jgi:CubicO group peptidase (beta-lactamase class C family)
MPRRSATKVVLGAILTAAFLAVACGIRQAVPSQRRLDTVSGGTTTVDDFESVVIANMRKAAVTGLSVAIVNHGRVAYTQQFGWRDKDAGATLNDTTIFGAASLSKTVFAYLVLMLAEDGLIDLDKPLQQYLPKPLSEYPRYADLASEVRYRAITARMALSHTTGLPNLRSDAADGRLRLTFEPGTRFCYSGEGTQLLQFVVEGIAQAGLNNLAREKVFGPFGMSNTSYVWHESFAQNAAAHHNEFEWASDPDRPMSADAAGSMMTTAHDYARFLAGILTARGKRREMVERMLTPQVRIQSPRMSASCSGAVSDAKDAISLSWGLGWGLFNTPHGRAFFHTGHKGGVQNYAVAYPDRGIGIVILSNSDNFESVAREIVSAGIGDTASPFNWLGYEPYDPARRKPAPPRPTAIKVPADLLAQYAGEYRFDSLNAASYVKVDGGRLYASDDAQNWDELLAQSATVFFFRGRTTTITFVSDKNGVVTGAVIENEGRKISARRVR